jgi:hypothetical protein
MKPMIVSAALCAVAAFCFSYGLAQTKNPAPQAPPPAQPPAALKPLMAEDVYQQVEIFKGKPATRLLPAMDALRGLLGVDCAHCHTPYDWANESKPEKQKARTHFKMIGFINHNYFADKNGATCWTCHRAHARPQAWQRTDASIQHTASMMSIPAESAAKPAEEVFMNIQSMKGVPANRFPIIMTMFSESLGVECSHCHVKNDFASDDKPEKVKARKMLGMVQGTLREFYGGSGPVGCYTCHQGKVKPESEAGKPTDAVFTQQ